MTRHVLACRDVIERCWPDRLDVPAAHGGRLVTFTARNEDGTAKVHVVLRPDGPSEVRDHAQAVALAQGEG